MDEELVTLEQVLAERLSPSMVADFDCVRGPHRWSTAQAGRFYFCLDCPKVRRIPWPDTRSLYGVYG